MPSRPPLREKDRKNSYQLTRFFQSAPVLKPNPAATNVNLSKKLPQLLSYAQASDNSDETLNEINEIAETKHITKNFKRLRLAANLEQARQSELEENDFLSASEDERSRSTNFRRLRRAPVADLQSPVESEEEGIDSASDSENIIDISLIDEQDEERHRKQLADNGWLERVNKTLRPLSSPVTNFDNDLRREFKLLKNNGVLLMNMK